MAEKKPPESEHSKHLWKIMLDLIDKRRKVAASAVNSFERALEIKQIQDAMDAVQAAIDDEEQYTELEQEESRLIDSVQAAVAHVASHDAERGN